MRNKISGRRILSAAGAVVLVASAVLLAVSVLNIVTSDVDIDGTVAFMEDILPEPTAGVKEERSNSEMPSVSYDGQDYAALLTVRRFSVKLPVRTVWDKDAVNEVPCRFTGNPYDGTLVIGGVDSDGQFDFVSKIDIGDEITVTDMKGYVFTYTVSTVKHAKNSKADTIIDKNYDLTLFAKDKKSGDWLLVKCKMK